MPENRTFTAFAGNNFLAFGDVETTVLKSKKRLDAGEKGRILIFDDSTGKQVDFDLHGTQAQVMDKLNRHPLVASTHDPDAPAAGPGRPRLGVVSREVTLLPRHWEWLQSQPGGVSVALRKLVDQARKADPESENRRRARDAAGSFMWAMAGDLPGFEDASRALYAGDTELTERRMRDWPRDIRRHVLRLSVPAAKND